VFTILFGGTQAILLNGNIMSLEEAPDGSATASDPLLAQGADNLVECQIWLLRNQSQQPILVFPPTAKCYLRTALPPRFQSRGSFQFSW
jgi:hypothetical protein